MPLVVADVPLRAESGGDTSAADYGQVVELGGGQSCSWASTAGIVRLTQLCAKAVEMAERRVKPIGADVKRILVDLREIVICSWVLCRCWFRRSETAKVIGAKKYQSLVFSRDVANCEFIGGESGDLQVACSVEDERRGYQGELDGRCRAVAGAGVVK